MTAKHITHIVQWEGLDMPKIEQPIIDAIKDLPGITSSFEDSYCLQVGATDENTTTGKAITVPPGEWFYYAHQDGVTNIGCAGTFKEAEHAVENSPIIFSEGNVESNMMDIRGSLGDCAAMIGYIQQITNKEIANINQKGQTTEKTKHLQNFADRINALAEWEQSSRKIFDKAKEELKAYR